MSVKTERIANLLVREISDILQNEVNDCDIKFVTITYCKVDTKRFIYVWRSCNFSINVKKTNLYANFNWNANIL